MSANNKTLRKSISISECTDGIRKHLIAENAHRVMQGFFLMHAQAHYGMPVDARGQGRKSLPTVGNDSANADSQGFLTWLEENFKGLISRATAYNYINAARHPKIGLTLEMTEAEAQQRLTEALQQYQLSGGKLSELYALPDSTEGGEGENKPKSDYTPVDELLKQTWLDLTGHLEHLAVDESDEVMALYELPLTDLQKLEQSTRRALDVIRKAREATEKGERRGRGK